jgi:flagellar L-ring protein precursor FlgH
MNKLLWSQFNRLALSLLLVGLSPAMLPADSLFKEETTRSMFADKRAAAVGDVLTILVQENNTTSKDASTKTSKKSGADIGISSFLYGPGASGLLTKGGKYPALKFDAKNEFDGSSAVGSSEKIIARIAVRVIDVLPNNQLVVEGTRQTTFSGETQDVVLRGVVRPEDITANNTVFSYNLADVTIKFIAKGTVSDGQKKGWFTRALDKINPF